MKRISALLTFMLLLLLVVPAMAESKTIFEMEDPTGDAVGDGNYTYPSFEELGNNPQQLLDLTKFTVTDYGKDIEFRMSFAIEPDSVNPWAGDGFNFHRIDIYLVTGEDGGKTETLKQGANVQFATPWNKLIKIVDWQQSKIFTSMDEPADPQAGIGVNDDFTVEVEGRDIVVRVAKEIIGDIDSTTQYYVLVGLADGLGQDQYLSVQENATEYVGGGGHDSYDNPNIYDMLAVTPEEQYQQLGSYGEDELAIIKPVGGVESTQRARSLLIVIIVGAIAGAVWVFFKKSK